MATYKRPQTAIGLKFKLISHNKAQTTANVIKVNGTSPVYFFISQEGNISVYNSHLKLVRTHTAFPKEEKRIPFVNSCAYLNDCKKLAMITSHQKMEFYDISATLFLHEYQISDLPFHPSCLAYASANGDNSILAIGAECGSICLLHFLSIDYMLFKKQDQYQVQKYTFKEICSDDQKHLVRVEFINSVHTAAVYQLHVHHLSPRLFSCSRGDRKSSLAVTDITGKIKTYRIGVESGINCFDIRSLVPVIATGSSDMSIRIWNGFATRRPVTILKGHENSVVAVRFVQKEKEILSFSRDGVFFVWSVDKWECMRRMFLPFPAFFVLGHKPRFSLSPVFVDEDRVLVTCSRWFVQLFFNKYPLVNESNELTFNNKFDQIQIIEDVESELRKYLTTAVASETEIKPKIEENVQSDYKQLEDANKHIMRRFVADGGPHWALKMYPLEEIDLSQFPIWQKVNKTNKGTQLAKNLMAFKVSHAFKTNKKD